jgi:hypothetical protein
MIFFNLIGDNHGLTRTFSSQRRGRVSLSLVRGHALFWGVADTATHRSSMAAPGRRPKPPDAAKRLGNLCDRTNEEHKKWRVIRASRAAFPSPHPDRRSAGGSRPAAYSNDRCLDENCGADGWAMTPSGTRGVLNDSLSIYFADATLASAFVTRWCVGAKVERRMSWRHGSGPSCLGRREGG